MFHSPVRRTRLRPGSRAASDATGQPMYSAARISRVPRSASLAAANPAAWPNASVSAVAAASGIAAVPALA